jgi:hypothetical protein
MALSMPQGCHIRLSPVRLAPDLLLLLGLVRKVDGMTGHQLWSICTDDEQNIPRLVNRLELTQSFRMEVT